MAEMAPILGMDGMPVERVINNFLNVCCLIQYHYDCIHKKLDNSCLWLPGAIASFFCGFDNV